MPASLLRKKKTEKVYDPVSAEVWAAGAKTMARVVELVSLVQVSARHAPRYKPLREELARLSRLTPCSTEPLARTQPKKEWSFDDYLTASRVVTALERIVVTDVDFVKHGEFKLFDDMRAEALLQVIEFHKTVEKYATLVKRERAAERLSGNKSGRR